MSPIRPIALIAALIALCPSFARAGVLALDSFAYPDGSLSDLNGGSGDWFTRWIGSGFVVSGGEVDGINSLPTNINTVRRHFTNPALTEELFVSFDLRIGNFSPALDDYAGLSMIIGVNNPVLAVGKGAGSNELVVGTGGTVSSGITLQPNTTYHIVAGYDLDQQSQMMWVNPDAADFYNPATGFSSADATNGPVPGLGDVDVIYWDTSRPGYILDNVVLSDTSDGVGIAVVPEPSATALLAFGLTGVFLGRYRRPAVSGDPKEIA